MALAELLILYVEDEPSNRKVMEIFFKEVMQIEHVTIFEGSDQFLSRLSHMSYKPNLIFLDIQMYPTDGYQLLGQLRALPDYRDVTIVALTANVMAHDVHQLKAAGFNGLIGKPVLEDVLPRLIEMLKNGEEVWYIP